MADLLTPLALPSAGDTPPFIPADWVAAVEIETTYRTDVSKSAYTLTEERRAWSLRPFRGVRVRLTGMDQAQSYRVFLNALRRARARIPIPIYCDQSETTASSSGTTINCDTTTRRFFDGGRVVIYKPLGAGVDGSSGADLIEWPVVDSHTGSALTLKAGLTNTYPAGCIVMPVMDAEVSLGGGLDLVTNRLARMTVSAEEILGASALPQEESGLPTGFPTLNGYPILNVGPDWGGGVSLSFIREGETFRAGRTEHTYLQGADDNAPPRTSYRLRFLNLSRAEASSLRRFFDSRVGMLKGFYATFPQDILTISAVGASGVTVLSRNPLDMTVFSTLAITLADGTQYVYPVLSIAGPAPADTWAVTFTTTIASFTPDQVATVCPAHFVRMAKDSLKESWTTDGISVIEFEVIEIIDELAAVIPNA